MNVGTGLPTTIRQVAELVGRHYPNVTTVETPRPPGDPLGGYASTRRMTELLSWRPSISIADGIAGYAAWLADNPSAIPDWMVAPAPAGEGGFRGAILG